MFEDYKARSVGRKRHMAKSSVNKARVGARADLALKIATAQRGPQQQGPDYQPFLPDTSLTSIYNPTGVPGEIMDPRVHESLRPTFEADTGVIRDQMDAAGSPIGRISGGGVRTGPTITKAVVPSGGRKDGKYQFGLQEKMAAEKDKSNGYMAAMRDAQQQIDELNRAALAAVQAGADDVARQYDEQIAVVEKELADARLNLKRSMAAYEGYAAQVTPAYLASVEAAIAGEAASKEALAGRADAAVAQIDSNREASVGDVEELVDLISTGDISYSGSIDSALGEFEGLFKEAARGSIGDIERISAAGAKFATALADAEFKTDLFGNEVERDKMEAQIQGQLDDLAEEVVKLERDKRAAVADAMSLYDPVGGFEDPDEAFQFAFESIALTSGWDLDEKDAVWGMFTEVKTQGILTHADLMDWIDGQLKLGSEALLEEWMQEQGTSLEAVPLGHLSIFRNLLSEDKVQSNTALGLLQRLYPELGLSSEVIGGFYQSRTDYDNLIQVFDAYETHVRDWEKNKYVPVKKGVTASNNWANRNAPQYKARRTVGVPTFSKLFLAAFGKSGTGREYVGGVTRGGSGTMREPSDYGGNRIANSDHMSGGAVDLYADTVEELEAIERWANSQPGVSYVTYSGASGHETGKAGGASSGVSGRGHVHVSLLLGYWG